MKSAARDPVGSPSEVQPARRGRLLRSGHSLGMTSVSPPGRTLSPGLSADLLWLHLFQWPQELAGFEGPLFRKCLRNAGCTSDAATRLLLWAIGSAPEPRNTTDNWLHSAQATHSPLGGPSGQIYIADNIAAVNYRQEQDGRIQYPG